MQLYRKLTEHTLTMNIKYLYIIIAFFIGICIYFWPLGMNGNLLDTPPENPWLIAYGTDYFQAESKYANLPPTELGRLPFFNEIQEFLAMLVEDGIPTTEHDILKTFKRDKGAPLYRGTSDYTTFRKAYGGPLKNNAGHIHSRSGFISS